MNIRLEMAKKFLAEGLSVIPSNGKVPNYFSWVEFQYRRATEDTINLWWNKWPKANVGYVTGKISNRTVIDIDGERGLASLKNAGINLPPTTIVKTPHGFHYEYLYNETYPEGGNILPGVDIRNDGGFIVTFPSTIDELAYELVVDAGYTKLPNFSILFPSIEKKSIAVSKEPDWVAKLLKEGAKEPGRNDIATRLAGHYRNKNISAGETYEILKSFAKKCEPFMDLNELWDTVQSVYKYALNLQGVKITEAPEYELIGESHFYRWPAYGLTATLDAPYYDKASLHCSLEIDLNYPGVPRITWGPQTVNLSTPKTAIANALDRRLRGFDWATVIDTIARLAVLREREGQGFEDLMSFTGDPPPVWLLRPYVVENEISILFGDGSAGKSTLALAIMLALQTGSLLLGTAPRRLVKGLYLDWESNNFSHIRRLRKFIKGHNIPTIGQSLKYQRCTQPLPETARALSKRIADEDIGFVIIDSVAGASGGEIEKSSETVKLFSAARRLNCSVLMIAHVTKNNDITSKPFGSTYWHNEARSTLEVKSEQDETVNHLALFHRKTNDEIREKPFGLAIHTTDDEIKISPDTPETSDVLAKELSAKDKIMRVLADGDKTVEEIAELTGMKPNTVRAALTRHTQAFMSSTEELGRGSKKTWSIRNKAFFSVTPLSVTIKCDESVTPITDSEINAESLFE